MVWNQLICVAVANCGDVGNSVKLPKVLTGFSPSSSRKFWSSYKYTIKQITNFRLYIFTCSTVLVISSHSILYNLLHNYSFHERTSGFKIYVICNVTPCRQMSSPPTFCRILLPSLQGQAVYFDCVALNMKEIRPSETSGELLTHCHSVTSRKIYIFSGTGLTTWNRRFIFFYSL